MADETVIISSPGLVSWGNGEFGDPTFGGQALSLGLLQGTVVTPIDVTVSITGTQLASAINSVVVSIDNQPQVFGTQINLTVNSVVVSIPQTVTTTGSRINLTPGEVTTEFQPDAGWGVYGYGIVPWGEGPDVTAVVTGTALSVVTHPVDINADGNESVNVDEDDDLIIYLNNVTTSADANVNVTGSRLNISEGLAAVVIRVDVIVPVTGTRINTSVGTVVGGTIQEVPVTGSQINISIGNETPNADANVNVTGSRINLTAGQVTYAAGYDVTGSRINVLIGQETVSGNAVVNVTGSRLNLTAGSVSITAWAEVQTGASNIWSPVDLAA